MDIHFGLTVIYVVVLCIVIGTSWLHIDTYRKLPSLAPFVWLLLAYKLGEDEAYFFYLIATCCALLEAFSSYGQSHSKLIKASADISPRKSIFTLYK